ncbi:MAG: T9SS type A sorting domain-containing protein [Flavobacteriales bacterium]
MKITRIILSLIITLTCASITQAQLLIDTISFPSQGFLNQTVQIEAVVRNEQASSRTGNLKFYLLNQTHPELGIYEFAEFLQLQFFAPNQSRVFTFSFPLSEQYFRTGGNTVVIWPSMVGQPGDSSVIVREIFIDEVSVTGGMDNEENSIRVYPNPSKETLHIYSSDHFSMNFEIYSMDGKLIKSGAYSENGINVQDLVPGAYIIRIVSNQAKFETFRRFFKE